MLLNTPESLKHINNPSEKGGGEGLYRHCGLTWLHAAEILLENGHAGGLGPFYYIVGHACELFTKAFLLWKGVSHRDLGSHKLGHDLKSLRKKAEELGLGLDKEYDLFFEALGNLNHKNMQRYPKVGQFTLGRQGYVEPENLIKWAKAYYEIIYGIIRDEKNAQNN